MRMGKKKQPTYRIVAADCRSPRDGRFIEIVGTYAPRADPSAVLVENDKAIAWLNKGAQPTETVRKLLQISGAWDAYSAALRPHPAKVRAPRKAAKKAAKSTSKAASPKKAAAKKAAAKPALIAPASVAVAESDKDE
jgi:small subunit ribosomal protein S16